MSKIFTLGGSFETGKTQIFERIQAQKKDAWQFVPDITKQLLTEHPTAFSDIEVMQEVLREAICATVVAIKNKDGRPMICDGSILDIAARGQFILDTQDYVFLQKHIRAMDDAKNTVYIQLPLTAIPTSIPPEIQYEQHHRINRILRKNHGIEVERVSPVIQTFQNRYNRVMGIIRKHTTGQ